MGPESEISDSLSLEPEKNRPLSKIKSAYEYPSNTLVPIQLAYKAMDLSRITLSLVHNKSN